MTGMVNGHPQFTSPDYVDGCASYLRQFADLKALLGSDNRYDTWIFQEKLYATVEGSQSVAVVLSTSTQWATNNSYNTADFPKLAVDVYADPERDPNNNVAFDDTKDKLLAVHDKIKKYLHMVDPGYKWWGSTRIVSSTLLSLPILEPVADGGGMRSAIAYYALVVG